MPRGRTMKPKRRTRKKRSSLAKLTRVPPVKVYPFTRSREQLLALEAPDTGATDWIATTDDCVVKTFAFGLSELPGFSEFTNLFREYKINSASIKFYPSYSQVISGSGSVVANNIIITVWPNTSGSPLDAFFSKAALNEIQRKRQWMFPLNKPTSIYMPLYQLNQVYGSTVNTDYTVVKPRYIATTETTTPHYGMNVHIQKCDNSSFTSDSPRLKIMEKIFLTCRQVM